MVHHFQGPNGSASPDRFSTIDLGSSSLQFDIHEDGLQLTAFRDADWTLREYARGGFGLKTVPKGGVTSDGGGEDGGQKLAQQHCSPVKAYWGMPIAILKCLRRGRLFYQLAEVEACGSLERSLWA